LQANVPSIDDMPNLKARLGKARTDKIRYFQNQPDPTKLKHAKNIENTVLVAMQNNPLNQPEPGVIDVLAGAARMGTGFAIPLSVNRLFHVFQCIPLINTREVMKMMDIEKRQAQRYVRAARFALPHLEEIFSAKPQRL